MFNRFRHDTPFSVTPSCLRCPLGLGLGLGSGTLKCLGNGLSSLMSCVQFIIENMRQAAYTFGCQDKCCGTRERFLRRVLLGHRSTMVVTLQNRSGIRNGPTYGASWAPGGGGLLAPDHISAPGHIPADRAGSAGYRPTRC